MKRLYKVAPRNSTVSGYPGRNYNWSLFDWEGKSIHKSIFKKYEDMVAPLPWVDGFTSEGSCQYLHVPYDWQENGTIYRVRPNDCMWPGSVYRGRRIKQQTVEQKDDIWYWVLKFE